MLSGDIEAPVDLFSATPLLTPVKYPYQAKDDGKITEVTVTSPLKWVLLPGCRSQRSACAVGRNRNQVKEELRHCLLQNLALELILEKQTGLLEILKGLRFAVDSTRIGALGTCLSSRSPAPFQHCCHRMRSSSRIRRYPAFLRLRRLSMSKTSAVCRIRSGRRFWL